MNRGLATPTGGFLALGARGEDDDDEMSEGVRARLRADAALTAADAFEEVWRSNASIRAKISGDLDPAAAAAAARPRRLRPGQKPTQSDEARLEKARADAKARAHPSAALFEDEDFRRSKVANLYRVLAPALQPRSIETASDACFVVGATIAATIPTALCDVTPTDAARTLVHLRKIHGDRADLVELIAANPSTLLTQPPPRVAAANAAAAPSSRAKLAAAGAAAADAVVSRVEAKVIRDVAASDDENEARTVTDGREDGKWRVGGTLKVGSSSSPSLLNSSLPSFFLPSSSSSLDPSHPTVP